MRIAIANISQLQCMIRHKQLSYASLAACVGGPSGPIFVDWSGVHVANQGWGPNQFWSDRTNLGC